MNQDDPGRPVHFKNYIREMVGCGSEVQDDLSAVAAGINHELIQKFGRFGEVRPVFTVVNTTTMPGEMLRNNKMSIGHSYIWVWVPEGDKRQAITVCRIEIGERLKLEIAFEHGGCETHSTYDYDDPMSLERLYGSIAEILEATLSLFPSSDNG